MQRHASRVVPVDPEDRACDFAPAGADQPGERDDLTGMDLERHVDEDALARQTLDAQHRVADVLLLDDALRQLTADHRAHEVVGRQAGHLAGEHETAVAEDGDAPAQRENLFEPVRDEQDRGACRAQRLDDAEQPLDLRRRERSRRLVHHDHPRVKRQRLRDLDDLLLGDRKAAGDPPWIERHPETFENSRRLRVHRIDVDPPPSAQRLPADEDVLGDREVREHDRLLVDDRDAGVACCGRALQHDLIAVDSEAAAVGKVHTAEDLHERGFAGAVLTYERVHLARVQIDRDVLEGSDRAECLRRVFEREDGLLFGHLTRETGRAGEGVPPARPMCIFRSGTCRCSPY